MGDSGFSGLGFEILQNGYSLLVEYHFEPMRFFWQFEWCGLFLVLLFGAMMITCNRSTRRENDLLKNHLEEQVRISVREMLTEIISAAVFRRRNCLFFSGGFMWVPTTEKEVRALACILYTASSRNWEARSVCIPL